MATTTPNYGWPVPTSTDFVKDGAQAIEDLGDAIDATVFGLGSGALTLVSATTIGTAVSSVTVTDAFSATYENYKIIVTGGASSATPQINLVLGASTTGYYQSSSGVVYATNAATLSGLNNAAFMRFAIGSANGIYGDTDFSGPFLAKHTYFQGARVFATLAQTHSGFHGVASSFTDFTITPDAGTLTGGTIYVYGYGI
jgi:hypothetical protein